MILRNITQILLTIFLVLYLKGFAGSSYNKPKIMLDPCAVQPRSLNYLFIRSNHTKSLSSLDTPMNLNPWFITGFTDGEGSFSLSIRDIDKDTKKGRVLYVFLIGLHKKDENILKSIQSTLGIGKIYPRGKEEIQFLRRSGI